MSNLRRTAAALVEEAGGGTDPEDIATEILVKAVVARAGVTEEAAREAVGQALDEALAAIEARELPEPVRAIDALRGALEDAHAAGVKISAVLAAVTGVYGGPAGRLPEFDHLPIITRRGDTLVCDSTRSPPPFSTGYQWELDDISINQAAGPRFRPFHTGSYRCRVTIKNEAGWTEALSLPVRWAK